MRRRHAYAVVVLSNQGVRRQYVLAENREGGQSCQAEMGRDRRGKDRVQVVAAVSVRAAKAVVGAVVDVDEVRGVEVVKVAARAAAEVKDERRFPAEHLLFHGNGPLLGGER